MRRWIFWLSVAALVSIVGVALAAGPPFIMPGTPFEAFALMVNPYTGTGIPATRCRVGTSPTKALVQAVSNGIYYTLDSTSGTPSPATAFTALASDWIYVPDASRFLAKNSSVATNTISVTCFQ